MQKVNYQLMLDSEIRKIVSDGQKPSLLLHVCCAPCSSYVIEYLAKYFDITLFYYNPNISSEKEYCYRVDEVRRLISEMPDAKDVKFAEGEYDTDSFLAVAKGHETEDEGGERCFACYRLRLDRSARFAKEKGFDYYTTTLSISPYKNAGKLNTIGSEAGEKYGVKYLFSDFKKKNGYKRSIELSAQYGLYRQDYCGCVFSKAAAERKKNETKN